MHHAGLFGLTEHLKRLSAHGDPLEELGRIIDFEASRPALSAALAYGDGSAHRMIRWRCFRAVKGEFGFEDRVEIPRGMFGVDCCHFV